MFDPRKKRDLRHCYISNTAIDADRTAPLKNIHSAGYHNI